MRSNETVAGARYGRLTVIERTRSVDGYRRVVCRCDCGNETTVRGANLRSGHTTSCGCVKAQRRSEALAKRREKAVTHTPEHRAWVNMRFRCNTPTSHVYHLYGGRGIKVCDEWDRSFEAFLRDVGRRPSPKHSLDRIDSNGNYEPGNVRWATTKQQRDNTTRIRPITFQGETLPLADWARKIGLPQSTLHSRIVTHGWSVERALTTPVKR